MPSHARLLSILAIALAGCSEPKPDDSGMASLAWAVAAGVDDLYTQYVGGRVEGAQDETGSCAFGGGVRVTGTTRVADGTQHVDLIYTMSACRIGPVSSDGDSHADLVLDGVLTTSGVFSKGFADLVHASDSLHMAGRVDSGEAWWEYDRSCALRINRQTSAVNALICAQNVAW